MKNLLKRLTMLVLIIAVIFGAGVTLAGCGKNPPETEAQVMTLSVNPSIEFILDEEDKVVSVTANNEDGLYLLQKYADYTGKSATEAAKIFLEKCEEYGFVVSGSITDEKFTISVSGEGAENLYNDVKAKVQQKATEIGLTIAEKVEITKEKLQTMVNECYQEYSQTELANFSEEKLIEMLKDSREETKDIVDLDEKYAYYKERAQKVISAKIQAVQNYFNEHPSILSGLLSTYYGIMNDTYTNIVLPAYNTINSEIDNLYNAASTGIKALADQYIILKKDYLAKFEAYKTATANELAQAKTEMDNAKQLADDLYEQIETKRTNAQTKLLTDIATNIQENISKINQNVDKILNTISTIAPQIQTQIDNQINALVSQYKTASTNPWAE